MSCEEIKSKKYQTRKSPPFHAKDCKGMTRKGKDGMYVSKADKNKVYKWVKVGATLKKKKGGKTYEIHDNMNRPFLVQDLGGKVDVYQQKYNRDNNEFEIEKKLFTIAYKKIFVGDNTLEQEGYAPKGEYKGNSILLQLSKNKYMSIGWKIEIPHISLLYTQKWNIWTREVTDVFIVLRTERYRRWQSDVFLVTILKRKREFICF